MDLTNTTIHQAACMQFVAASIYNWPEKQAFFPPFFLCVIVRVEQTLPPLFFSENLSRTTIQKECTYVHRKSYSRERQGRRGPSLAICHSALLNMAHTHTPLSTNLDLLLSLASCGPDLNISVCYNVDRLFTAGQEHWEDPISETCLFGIKKPSRGVRDAFSIHGAIS